MARWRIKCQNDNTWSHSKFSKCITCDDLSDEIDALDTDVNVQTVYRKNLEWNQFFCGDSTDHMTFMGKVYKKGGNKRNVKCVCKNGQNGDPSWKKSCSWKFQGKSFDASDVSGISCGSKQPSNGQPDNNDALDAQNQANADAQNSN